MPLIWFFGKVFAFIFFFIWLRGTLPRMRYDQFMALGWKWLIPASLIWIVAVATIRAVSLDGGIDRQYLLMGIGVALVLLLGVVLLARSRLEEEDAEAAPADESSRVGSRPRRCPPAAPSRARRSR